MIACKSPRVPGVQSSQIPTAQKPSAAGTVQISIPNYPLKNKQDLDILLNEIGDARIVLLGEASHGTSEYYTWRTAISKRLIQEKEFDFIAVEAEWADSYRVNQFIRGQKKDSAAVLSLLKQYNRWPTWMWGNYEVASLVSWLNSYNQPKNATEKIGFYGLDVFCIWESLNELISLLKNTDAVVQTAAKKVHQCFQPYSKDISKYATAQASATKSCSRETNKLWQFILNHIGEKTATNETDFLMQQYALVVFNGERYYTAVADNYAESWNIRDRHMALTLKRLLEFHGKNAKAIVWEHNTHVGDAKYTSMTRSGQINIGELARKEHGEKNVYIIGFGSYSGSVIAAERWGANLKKMEVPPAAEGSWEHILHKSGASDKIILSKDIVGNRSYNRWIDQRAIGVVYNPQLEKTRNYVPSIIPRRYDAFIFIDKTTALRPLGTTE
ncbi:MAG: erythromycin esterase family protein [Chitinophagaceae bacterium]